MASTSWIRTWATVAAVVVIAAAGAAQAAATDTLFGEPAFDSGWRDLSTGMNTFSHGLGGSSDDYVVDLQLRDLSETPSVHNLQLGGDSGTFAGGTENHGAHLWSLSASSAVVYRASDDGHAFQARVRIWVVASPEYDSGWRTLAAGADLALSHGLGGSAEDYVVDLTFKGGTPSRVHKTGYGGERFWNAAPKEGGAYWHSLGTSSVTITRGPDDSFCQQARLRIFRRPSSDYDSGWRPLATSSFVTLVHDLGGPWNDFVVDLQFRDTSMSGIGVNQRAYGGDLVPATATGSLDAGTHWHSLTGSSITVYRHPWDGYADQVRVRIWEDRSAAYDSGWTAVTPGESTGLAHGLGGDPDMYVVDMAFKDTGPHGVNVIGYGEDTYAGLLVGAEWLSLTDASIQVHRGANDVAADLVRVRLWQAPMPEYDSGWESIAQGEEITLSHGLGGVASDYVVDLQMRSAGLGRHQAGFGSDYFDDGDFNATGVHWEELGTSTVKVHRAMDDVRTEEVRLRIWKNTSFDWFTSWQFTSDGAQTYNHNLALPADDLVVDMQQKSGSSAHGTHQFTYGGDAFDAFNALGAWWEQLGSSSITVWRVPGDLYTDQVRVRLWSAPSASSLFSDGFESGNVGAWSSSAP